MRLTYVTKFMFAFALLFMSIGGLHEPLAANKPADSRSRASELLSPSRPLILSDLEAWTDGYLPFAMQREDIVGAVVVVVKDGKILFKKVTVTPMSISVYRWTRMLLCFGQVQFPSF